MQCSQVYSLPVVYQDLRQPFVLKDIVQQLDQLDTVVNDVVNRLQFKVSQCPTPEENRQIIWLVFRSKIIKRDLQKLPQYVFLEWGG